MDFSTHELSVAGLSQAELAAITGIDENQDDSALEEIAGEEATPAAIAGPDVITFTPQLSGELLPEFAQAVEGLYAEADRRTAAIEERFLEGDIDEAERRAELRRLDRERDAEIRRVNAASQNAEIAAQKWQAEQESFFRKNQEYTDPFLFNVLNTEVIRLANLPESAGKTGIQILQEARENIDRQIAGRIGATRQRRDQANDRHHSEPEQNQYADSPGRFAHIDRLTGVAFEQALARMTEAEQAAYLRSL